MSDIGRPGGYPDVLFDNKNKLMFQTFPFPLPPASIPSSFEGVIFIKVTLPLFFLLPEHFHNEVMLQVSKRLIPKANANCHISFSQPLQNLLKGDDKSLGCKGAGDQIPPPPLIHTLVEDHKTQEEGGCHFST